MSESAWSNPAYPVKAALEAPSKVARWRVIGNPILAIPHVVVLYVLQIVANLLALVAWFVVLFTAQMPPGIGTFIAAIHRYQWRVASYALFLREPYPAFSIPNGYPDPGGDPAWLQIDPPVKFSRLAVFFRVILVIPLALEGFILGIALDVVMFIAFFAVLITGRWPVGLRKFVVDVLFWWVRVNAWYQLLADPYPPFSIG
ncbi:MAG: DUF4389 domain-containing protein [Acidimicrobiales bacterium]|nr:DUF4389 domain-containing protein [Acidimicrobiales bacterium]